MRRAIDTALTPHGGFLSTSIGSRIDAAAWVAILERLHSAKNTEEIQDLNDILRWAPLPLLEERFGALEQAGGKVTKPTLDFAHKRLEFAGKDQPTLWNELLAFAAEADAKARYVTDLDRDGADILIEALARHDRPTATEMIELIGDYQKEEWFEKDYWLHCLYVDLIGERRMREMIPTLVDFFHLDADYLRERTQLALARMRDSEAVRLVRQAFPHETWEYCNYAVEVLGQSRVPEAEPAILELLDSRWNLIMRIFCLNSRSAWLWSCATSFRRRPSPGAGA